MRISAALTPLADTQRIGVPNSTGSLRALRRGDWSELVAIAEELVLTPALWPALRKLDVEPPKAELELLQQRHLWNAARNIRFRHGLTEAVGALNQVGVVPLLLKGGVSLVDGTVEDVGCRWMADLDLAVPVETLPETMEALAGVGFEAARPDPFGPPHELLVVRKGCPGPIELHTEIGVEALQAVLPTNQVWAASSELSFASVDARVPSPTHQVLHCILHSALVDLNHSVAGLPLRQLMTLTQLVQAHGSSASWAEIDTTAQAHGLTAAVRAHVWLAHRLCGLALPAGYRGGLRERLHEARVLANFGLGWPAELQRNLHFAFGRDYLDSLYSHGGRPLRLAVARARHTRHLLHRDWRANLEEAVQRRA
jgi:hypothetical protein